VCGGECASECACASACACVCECECVWWDTEEVNVVLAQCFPHPTKCELLQTKRHPYQRLVPQYAGS
jgi:hypothetical protein